MVEQMAIPAPGALLIASKSGMHESRVAPIVSALCETVR
jgi:hypothetical protein